MILNYQEGLKIAESFDVKTSKDCAVVYSVSFLPTKENKEKAYAYVKTHIGCKTLDDTICGKILCAKGFQCTNDTATAEVKKIWKIASERFIMSASGNITAFVKGADKRSTFYHIEMPKILENEKIKTINGVNKQNFLKNFQK